MQNTQNQAQQWRFKRANRESSKLISKANGVYKRNYSFRHKSVIQRHSMLSSHWTDLS